ncbi:hypothetical protein [Vibrio metschnikovii]|uniref:hypothetical protein n=1 Tax=Vibrio metschnikovii TaxID=28172 RepID=UPI0001B944C6|nr:hypothetical protein [Vibrio metschnikovii]EEX36811.1 hypothetical protein VIB_000917 [Vibrio metschnikovii CIP 69.14]SUP09577.1 Uncharacterised protein [Vibrio metschnikovii]
MSPKIALVIGNGFSMSFGYHSGLQSKWNTQSFLDWDIKSPTSEDLLIDLLPNLSALKNIRSYENDFEVFEYLQSEEYCKNHKIDQLQCFIEARHYLTIAFSHLAVEQALQFDTDWSWFQWMKKHRDNIAGAFSLNYDLLLEKCLDQLRLPYDSCQVNGHGSGIPLCKPHGSVDFEILEIKAPVKYPLNGRIDLNDTPIYRLSIDELLYPRTQPLCIVPNENNKYINFQWVEEVSGNFQENLKDCTHCIIIGVSYFDCDQPEIDHIISKISPSCEVIIANPTPPPELLAKLEDFSCTLWKSNQGPVDESGNCIMLKDLNTGKVLRKCFCGSGKAYQYCCSI